MPQALAQGDGRQTECEYCGQAEPPLYGWHADVWCRACIEAHAGVLQLAGDLDSAPVGRPQNASYAAPFILKPKAPRSG